MRNAFQFVMKNIFLFIITVTLSITNVFAQKGGLSYRRPSNTDNSFHIGVMEGVTLSQITGDGQAGFRKPGMTGGILARRFFSKLYAVQMEVIYKEKGSRYYAPQDKTPATAANNFYTAPTFGYLLRLNYIEIPLLFQYNIPKIDIKTLTAEVGLSYGFLVSSQEFKTEPGYNRRQYGPAFKYGEAAYHIGISYLHESNFGIALRYSRSITPAREFFQGEKSTLLTPGQMNHVLSLTLNYQLSL